MTATIVFTTCVEAIRRGVFIVRESRQDKEFHFQNWFKERLNETGFNFDQGGRNSYPDFTMVKFTEGYELKGLAYPGRDASFDSNSQVPTALHNGRTVYYVFGRYPRDPDGNSYPVLDLVVCHGSFLNADHDYVHQNKSVRGFGSYGDILIRDRKMYVVPTPFRLVEGLAHEYTLLLPAKVRPEGGLVQVAELTRREADEMVIGYSFNLQTNTITPKKVPNPGAGTEHSFTAWRLKGSKTDSVSMRTVDASSMEPQADPGDDDDE